MKKMPKNAQNFYCEVCDFACSKKSNYESHLRTAKHRNRTISNDFSPKNAEYFCECGKRYTARNSLWYHKKKCTYLQDITDTKKKSDSSDTKQICQELMPMFKEMMMDIAPVLQPNNTINDNRQNFNINMFLNEQCKDAMNLTDFVNSIQLTIEDVTNIGKQGQTSGFANILIDKLTSMDLYKRPLHCSDTKRETLYVKNNDEWNKETEDRTQIKDAINHISFKGIQKVPDLSLPQDEICNTISEIVHTPVNHKKIISKVVKEIKVGGHTDIDSK